MQPLLLLTIAKLDEPERERENGAPRQKKRSNQSELDNGNKLGQSKGQSLPREKRERERKRERQIVAEKSKRKNI